MFHEGTLQSGISRAIQERKLVACFVRDDGEESAIWENEWLQNGWISSLLTNKAVLLRLEAGSQEAGFLSAFCPISDVPAFIVIHNGELREQLVSGIGRDEFINRIRKVLGANPIPVAPPVASPPSDAALQEPPRDSTPVPNTQAPAPVPPPQPSLPVAPAPAPEEHHPVSPILPPSSKARGKQKVNPPGPNPDKASSSISAAQQSARSALRKKKQEEKEELARIQARIEADKAERKAQAEARKIERERLAQPSSTTLSPAPTSTRNRASQAKTVALNIRLFDGRTIRNTFPRTANLQNDVRPWVDTAAEARAETPDVNFPPYYFKQILAPLPSRELSAGDESATLVLVPVKGYTEAYSGGGGGGLVGDVVGGVTGLVGGAFGLAYNAVGYVGGALGSVVGISPPGSETESGRGSGSGNQGSHETNASSGRSLGEAGPEASRDSGIRVRTLADQREREPRSQELYNGNQLNFEPNEDESNRR